MKIMQTENAMIMEMMLANQFFSGPYPELLTRGVSSSGSSGEHQNHHSCNK